MASDARGLAALPEAAGRPHRVALEGGVGGGVGARELGVEIVDDATNVREFAVDLAREELRVGRQLEARIGREDLQHRVERAEATAERLRLRELDEHAPPRRRRRREERERAAREHEAVVAVGRACAAVTEHEHAPRPPREQRRRGERADAPHRARRRRSASSSSRQPSWDPWGARAASSRARGRGRWARAGDAGERHHLDAVVGDPLEDRRRGARAPRRGCAREARPRRRSSSTGTTACAMIGPVSVPASTKCTVQPVTLHAVARTPALCALSAGKRREQRGVDVDDAHAGTRRGARA